jgi:hypothetical protein
VAQQEDKDDVAGTSDRKVGRRSFLASAATAAAGVVAGADAGAEPAEKTLLAPPCGLYCGSCDDYAAGICHGCACDCGKCNGAPQARACSVRKCADARGAEHCGTCREFACSLLIGFCNDPIWVSHRCAIDNLRRRNRLGTRRWLAEQADYWRDPSRRKAMLFLLSECKERARRARG